MAAGGTGQNRLSYDLPARPAGSSAILNEGHSEGVQENLEKQLSAVSYQLSWSYADSASLIG
jgi:hypothetical protein